MKKPTAKDKRQVLAWVNKWQPKLYLNEWSFDIEHTNKDESNSAEVSVLPTYMDAKIWIHNGFWKLNKKDREHTIVHELCHCITEPSYKAHIDMLNFKVVTTNQVDAIRETMTQRIANIAFWD